MKRFVKLLLITFSASPLFADVKIEGGASYFSPQSETLREIYGGGVNYHFTVSQEVYKNLDLWAGANYFDKNGHSLRSHQRTNINIIPVNLGLKYLFPVQFKNVKVDFYLNGAFKYYFLYIHDNASFVKKHSSKNGFGVVFGGGSYVYLTKHLFLNFLIDYSFKEFHDFHHERNTESHSIDISGWDFGGGIGLKF